MSEYKKNTRWSALGRVSNKHGDGHRLFIDKLNPTRVAVADNSGTFPEDCDDGILYIDVAAIERDGALNVVADLTVHVPLLVPKPGTGPHGFVYEQSRTMFDVLGAADLISMLKLNAKLLYSARNGKTGASYVFEMKEISRG